MSKLLIAVVVCTLVLASPAWAQEEEGWDKRVFAFGGGGGFTGYYDAAFFHVGGGFETVHPVGIGFVVDFGYQGFPEAGGDGFASFAPGLMYEFPMEGKLKPYVRVGLGWITDGHGAAGLWNIGGGVNYFFRERTGVKVELRDSFEGSYVSDGMLEVLVGIVHRF